MKGQKAGKKTGWRQSVQVPMGGAQWKAVFISGIIFGVLLTVSISWVVFAAIEHEGAVFAPTIKFERPPLQPKKPPMRKPPSAQPNIASKHSESAEILAPARESDDRSGVFSDEEGYEMLAERPAADLRVDDSLGAGFFSRQRNVQLGGSWEPRAGAGNVTQQEWSSRKDGAPITLYAVFFRMTADHEGKLVDFELAEVVDPRAESNVVIQVDIPERYIELARIRAASLEHEPSASAAELLEFYDYFFFCPDYPERVIPRPSSGGA